MKLKCTASIGDIYWQVNEKSAEGFKSKRDSNTVYNTFVSEEDGPQGKKHTVEKSLKKKSHIFSLALDSPHGLASGWNSGPRCTQQPNFYLLVAFLSVVLSAKNWQNQQN